MRVRPFLRFILVALCATLLLPVEARAHGHLVRARPGAGDTVRVAPRELRLEFSEAPELAVSSVRLVDSLGRAIHLLALRADADSPRVLIAGLAEPLAGGRYRVSWEMAGRDGHPMHGQYSFVLVDETPHTVVAASAPGVGPAAAGADTLPPEGGTADSSDAESLMYVLVRWAHFIGLLIVIGGAAFYWLVLRRASGTELTEAVERAAVARARRVAAAGVVLLALTTIGRLVAQWTVVRASAADPAAMSIGSMVTGTEWGHAWLLEIVGLVAAFAGLVLAQPERPSRTGWSVIGVAAVVLASAAAMSGHAAVADTGLPLVVDSVHVLAAGSWMGALLLLLTAGLPAARASATPGRSMTELVNRFSATALASAAVVVLTGAIAAWRNMGTLGALTSSAYGRVLVLKLGVLAIAALIGLYNWRRARPALAASGDDAAIRRAMRAELAAAAVILLVTAVLVAIPTPVTLVSMR